MKKIRTYKKMINILQKIITNKEENNQENNQEIFK